jgi:diaminopropionate ammonia-lyase
MQNIAFSAQGLIVPPTRLLAAPSFARRAGVDRVLLKMESERALGSFKILGGMFAALHVLSDMVGKTISDVVGKPVPRAPLPRLLCASDGNHGLAVAAAARLAGTAATVFLHGLVERARADRIERMGGHIQWVAGTYDAAVGAAVEAARGGDGLLVPDTSDQPDDPVVRLVMRGYGVLAGELVGQLGGCGAMPSHAFVQAGVGGLAAAIATGLQAHMQGPNAIVVAEPDQAACVGPALVSGRVDRIGGDLNTSASMLSCGTASAPAVAILRAHGALSMTVNEAELNSAVRAIEEDLSVRTSTSGAARLAGLFRAASDPLLRATLSLTRDRTVILIVTEGV